MNVSIKEIENMTQINEIKRLYSVVLSESAEHNSKMEDIGAKQDYFLSQISLLEKISSKIDPIMLGAAHLLASVEETNRVAETVSKKARELDSTIEQVRLAKSHVQDIVDLTECVEGAQFSIRKSDWEGATTFIERYLKIDPSLLDNNSRAILERSHQELVSVVTSKMAVAVSVSDLNDIVRFGKLHAPLKKKMEGLTSFCEYLSSLVRVEIEQLLGSLSVSKREIEFKGEGTVNYTAVAKKIVQIVEQILKDKKVIMDEMFGKVGFIIALRSLQHLSESYLLRVLSDFSKDSKLTNIVSKLNAKQNKSETRDIFSLVSSGEHPKDDFHELPSILQQIVFISQVTQLHQRWANSIVKTCVKLLEIEKEDPEIQNTLKIPVLKEGELSNSKMDEFVESVIAMKNFNIEMQTVLAHYLLLETHFINKSVGIILSDAQIEYRSSETFVVLNDASHRAKVTFDLGIICAFINNVNTLLLGDYFSSLHKSSVIKGNDLKTTVLGLNNIDSSVQYCLELKQQFEGPCQKAFKSDEKGLMKVMATIHLFDETERRLKILLQTNMESLSSVVHSKIEQILRPLNNISYVLSLHQLEQNNINDPFIEQFIQNFTQIVNPYKVHLNENNQDLLVLSICRYVCDEYEKIMLTHSINKYGAVQFEKEFMAIMTFLCSLTKRSIRDRFVRLQQITQLINIDKQDEIRELKEEWNDMGGSRLGPNEIKKIVMQRVEFRNNYK